MYPKPPITRTEKSRWFDRRGARLKSLAAVGVVTLGFAGAGIAAAIPASADPAVQFVGVGSDTTQNLMDFFAATVGNGVIGSYDAVNPTSQAVGENILPAVASTTAAGQQTQCNFTRPNGSTNGFAFLDFAWNPATSLALTTTGISTPVPPSSNCTATAGIPSITFSRSSAGPGKANQGNATGPGSTNTSGLFVYIPYAVDAVTDATGPTTAISQTTQCNGPTTPTGFTCSSTTGIGTVTFTTTPTKITTAAQFTKANLQSLYATCAGGTAAAPNDFVAVGGVNYFPNGDAPTGAANVNIDLYAPQSGSGTLSFWESAMGVTATQSCWHQTIIAGPATGVQVQEHDGTALASDPNSIGPISIAKWVGFNSGLVTPNVNHGDILQPIVVSGTSVPPLNGGGSMNVAGCGATFNQATCFPITREVYNVLPYNEVVNSTGDTQFNPTLAGLFAGTGSVLCQSSFTINQLGFGTLPNPAGTTFADLCGSTANSLRVQMNNTAAAG